MTHGGNIFEIQRKHNINKDTLVDFSSNINPLGIPESLKTLIIDKIAELECYPDIHYHQLKTIIAEYYSLDQKDIFVGNGAAQVIYDAIHAVKPKMSIILAPTFSEYERALVSHGSKVQYHYLEEKNNFNLREEDLIGAIDDSVDLVVLCNPNNPTSKLIKKDNIKKILDKCKKHNTFLMIDEAFMDFVEDDEYYSMLGDYREYNNLIIVRAFTKFYGIPGLRLGFGISRNEKIIASVSENTIPWSLNTFAGYFGQVLLSEKEYVEKTYNWLREEKKRFVKKLAEIEGITVYIPSVNFILIKIVKENVDVDILKERLLKENILIRDCSNFNGLSKKFFRIAIKDPILNDRFVDSLIKAMDYSLEDKYK